MKKLLIILLIINFIDLSAESYIVKFKEIPAKNNFLGAFEKFEPAINQNIINNSKNKYNFLSAKQENMLSELHKYYVIETDNPDALALLENIESITPNYKYKTNKIYSTPDDPLFSEQWSLEQINAPKAWQKATGKGVIIGLIDTGVDFEHEDLVNNLWINNPEDINKNGRFDPWPSDSIINGVSGDLNGIDEDGNGFIDDVIGFDHINQKYANFGDFSEPDPIPEDEGDHGTSVAGIMLAEADNGKGIAGVAPDAVLLTSKAMDATGNGEADDIANAIIYAVLNGARILNFSFGESYDSPIMHDAIKFAYESDVFMVASSGNSNWYGEHYPSDYTEVMCVGGSDESGNKFGLSNYGSYLDIIAPGLQVLTLEQNNQYSRQSGTSIAAPMVAGVAAMILELNPNLKPNEIKGILQSTATDVGDEGWDVKHGSGILNAGKALDYSLLTDISISEPYDKTVFITDTSGDIKIFGNVLAPLFDSYEILIGEGILPSEWKIAHMKTNYQVKDSLIGTLPIQLIAEKDTTYTLSLKVNLKNTKTIEHRIQILTLSNTDKYEVSDLKHRSGFENNKSVYLVSAKTNQNSLFSLKYRIKGREDWKILNDDIARDKFHLIKIDNPLYDIPYEAVAEFTFANNYKLTEEFEFTVKDRNFRQDKFVKKFEGNKRNYLWNETADLYGNGKKYFAGNDLSMLNIGTTEIYYYQDNEIYLKEANDEIWICKGLGDTDGNGNMEFLGTGDHKTILYEFNPENASIFDNIKFQSENGSTFWSEHLYDLDKDGKDEIIAYNDTSFFALKSNNGKYDEMITAEIKNSLKKFGLVKGSALGDFNGNGKANLVHTNSYGMIFIYEYDNGKLNSVFIDSNIVAQSNQYMAAGDIDNDGKEEIIHLSSGTRYLYGTDAAVKNIWYLRIFSHNGNDYEIIADEVIFGVRSGFIQRLGISYRNGVAAGNIDNQPGDEIIISAFPNLYAFKYDNDNLKPFWYNSSVLSNDVIIDDFDNNGINEIGFSSFNNLVFYEFMPENDAPATPVNIEGWAMSDTSAYLKWNGSDDAEIYQIYEIIFAENSAEANLITISEDEEVYLDSLEKNKNYIFSVVAFNPERENEFSEFSELVEIYTHKLYEPLNAEALSQNQIVIEYSGELKNESHPAGEFEIVELNGIIPRSAIRTNNNRLLLTYSDNLLPGNYSINIGEIKDVYNSPTISSSLEFEVLPKDTSQELYLKRLQLLSKSLIKLEFSEEININEALNPDNYEIKPFGKVDAVSIGSQDTNFVMMNISSVFRSSAARGFDYTLTASNITSKTGKPMTGGPGNTLGFVVASQTLDEAYVYPNPVRLSSGDPVFFANLTKEAVVEITTLQGKVLKTLIENDGNGGVEWDGTDESGKLLTPGIYLFKVEGYNDNDYLHGPVIKKFMILQ